MALEGGFVVGLDNGGTSQQRDGADRGRASSWSTAWSRCPAGSRKARRSRSRRWSRRWTPCSSVTGVDRAPVRGVGLDTPGPASADGVISSKGATNFSLPDWRGFDFRGALEARLGLPVVYNNDGNAAALYAHFATLRARGAGVHARCRRSSAPGSAAAWSSRGQVVKGAAGMAGELGHVHIPMEGLLAEGQPVPQCNCGFVGDVESVASLTGIEKQPAAVLAEPVPRPRAGRGRSPAKAAKLVRGLGEQGDPLALQIFEQQAMALGRLFTIAANFTDPRRLLRRRRRGRGRARSSATGSSHGPRPHRPARGAAAGGELRARARPGHGRRPRRRRRRPRRPRLTAARADGRAPLNASGIARCPCSRLRVNRGTRQSVVQLVVTAPGRRWPSAAGTGPRTRPARSARSAARRSGCCRCASLPV